MMYFIYLMIVVAASAIIAHCYNLDKVKIPIITLGVALLMLWQYGFTASFIKVTLFTTPLIIVSFYDLKTHHIPMAMVAAMLLVGVIIEPLTILQMLAAIIFVLVFLLPFVFLDKGLGMGDIYLLIPIAIVLGLPNLLYVVIFGLMLFMASIALTLLYQRIRKKKIGNEKLNLKTAYPLGPWLSLGSIIMFFLQ